MFIKISVKFSPAKIQHNLNEHHTSQFLTVPEIKNVFLLTKHQQTWLPALNVMTTLSKAFPK